jgi:hypothetical protein
MIEAREVTERYGSTMAVGVNHVLGLADVAHRRSGGFSLGMGQRLGIVAPSSVTRRRFSSTSHHPLSHAVNALTKMNAMRIGECSRSLTRTRSASMSNIPNVNSIV